jgi:peptidyl-prolyl cis-trans isomerase C
MRFVAFPVLIYAAVLCAQTPAAPDQISSDTVVASFEGKKLTYGELRGMMSMLPADQQQALRQNPQPLVHQYFLMQHLAEIAEKNKLDQQSPTREWLEFERRKVLAQAALDDIVNHLQLDDSEVQKYYEAHKDKYAQVKVKTIYVSFTSNPEAAGGAKVLNEEEAKAKINKILAEIRAGADFVKMVKQYSEDATSRDKDGDLETFRKSDSLPDAVREAVFKLKQGEVSGPVRQPNGFYLFRAENVGTRTFQEIQREVYEEARQAKSQQWMQDLNNSIKFKIEAPSLFKSSPPPAAPAPK